MSVVEEQETSGGHTGGQRVSRLPHDQKDGRDGEGAHCSGHGAVRDVRDLVGDVRVANVLEQERAIVTDEPTSEREEELSERRVDVEEVGPLQVV